MKALEGVKILDFTHVQSGPTCTQLLGWFGADVIKVERPGVGDATRGQLQDIPDVDSLYFTMLNHNKRSVTLNSKSDRGKEILTRLIEECDVMVENFAPGALDRMGFSWERIQEINPRMIYASVKGFGIVTALYQRTHSGRGQRVSCAMQDGVLNLCRVKLRDQQRLDHGPLKEYSQFGEGVEFGEATPRAGNDSGGGQPGRILKCKGWEADPDAYTYFITQAAVWKNICDTIGKEEWKEDPDFATPDARLPRLNEVFDAIEAWTMTKTKFEVLDICNPLNIPVGPILSMKELAEEPSLRETGTIVEVEHPERGTYLTVGNPVKLSDSPSEVVRSPLLGEHTDEILREVVGLSDNDIAAARDEGAI